MTAEQTHRKDGREWWWFLAIAVIMLGAAWLRWHLLAVPLERDEGEYAYGGQLLLQGVPPYQLLYSMKLPGIYAAYALVLALFGQDQTGVHLGLLAVNLMTIALVALLARRVAGPWAGIGAGAVFAVLSMGQPVQGVFANAEHFVLLPALAGLLTLMLAVDGKRPWLILLSGVLLGLGVLVKQHGVLFVIFGVLYLFRERWLVRGRLEAGLRQGMLLVGAALLPYLCTSLLLLKAGVFPQFWFWTVEYARAYATQLSWAAAWSNLSDRAETIVAASPLLWLAVAVGCILALVSARQRQHRFFIVGLACASLLAVCPGLFFRPHYFILLLPAAALLAGIGLASLGEWIVGRQRPWQAAGMTVLLIALGLGQALYQQRQFLFVSSPAQASSDTYWPNPFNESPAIARFLREHSRPTDTIAIIGSEPQIFFYSGRRSATGYIYMYPLMEGHEFALTMQQRLIAEVEKAAPEYLIFVRNPLSWLQRPTSHTLIYEWFTHYVEGYQQVGLIEIFDKSTTYTWFSEVRRQPATQYWIEVLRKKGGSGTVQGG